jgi:putative FmdB family regulatory protein
MPIYEFECKNKKCQKEYAEQIPMSEYDETGKFPNVKCPHCGSVRKRKLLSVANFQFAQPEGTDRYNNSHDYRFNHKQPSIRAERELAEKASRMGANPYNPIDDVGGGEYFGEVQ